ncbi:MAG: OmpA family protein [Candidatus Kapaibacterium sp.]|nr:OmpA family protein [Bacteroidota bacterium]
MKQQMYQDDVQHDRYLITYADVITLLLCLFVILYATSQVDGGKYKELAHAASSYFKPASMQDSVKAHEKFSVTEKNSLENTPQTAETSAKSLTDKLKTQLLSGNGVAMEELVGGVKLTLAEELLFDAGNSELHPESLAPLDRLAAVLKSGTYEITVDGHTDCVPMHSFRFESNWHLSVDRALAVGYYLTQQGVPEHSMIIRGFGSQRPVVDNATPENRKRNRRVEIMVRAL